MEACLVWTLPRCKVLNFKICYLQWCPTLKWSNKWYKATRCCKIWSTKTRSCNKCYRTLPWCKCFPTLPLFNKPWAWCNLDKCPVWAVCLLAAKCPVWAVCLLAVKCPICLNWWDKWEDPWTLNPNKPRTRAKTPKKDSKTKFLSLISYKWWPIWDSQTKKRISKPFKLLTAMWKQPSNVSLTCWVDDFILLIRFCN